MRRWGRLIVVTTVSKTTAAEILIILSHFLLATSPYLPSIVLRFRVTVRTRPIAFDHDRDTVHSPAAPTRRRRSLHRCSLHSVRSLASHCSSPMRTAHRNRGRIGDEDPVVVVVLAAAGRGFRPRRNLALSRALKPVSVSQHGNGVSLRPHDVHNAYVLRARAHTRNIRGHINFTHQVRTHAHVHVTRA